jgi:dethiobiotin synthetase
MTTIVVTATDTDVGKTVFAAALTLALDGLYWKPVQSGTRDGTDRETVARLTGLPAERLLPERYVLSEPLSPHRSAELDGVTIDPARLALPATRGDRPLIVEGAGGVLVPLTRTMLQIELFARWRAPVVVCARTALGTINHSLLTIEALHRRDVPILGVAFIGDAMADSEATICAFANVPRLGRLPALPTLDRDALVRAFAENFRAEAFVARGAA